MIHAQSSQYYDLIYAAQGKDYARETQVLYALIQQHKLSEGNTLLDVACGTGAHSYYLQNHFAITGVDIDADMLTVARGRCPNLEFVQGDMTDFKLGKQFDIVVCLFSSIGYVKTLARLNQTLVTFKHHLRPGGLLVLEPWLYPGEFSVGYVNAIFVDQPDFKLVRMNVSDLQDGVSVLDFKYMLATPKGVERFDEHHELGLFSPDDYTNAFQAAGFDVTYDSQGLTGRGLFIGSVPAN